MNNQGVIKRLRQHIEKLAPGKIIAHLDNLDDFPGVAENNHVNTALDNMEGLALCQVLMGPDIGIFRVHDEHLMDLIVGVLVSTQPDAPALIKRGMLFQIFYLPMSDFEDSIFGKKHFVIESPKTHVITPRNGSHL
jgi:hypothetical protein